MKYKYIIILIVFGILLNIASADSNKKFDDEKKTLYIIDPGTDEVLMSIQQISNNPDIVQVEEIFNITSYKDYTFDKNNDFNVLFSKFKGKHDIKKMKWESLENVEYDVTVPDIMEEEINLTISDIISYKDISNTYNNDPLYWGNSHDRYKWKINSRDGTFTIGFDHYEENASNPESIAFFRIETREIGSHIEPRYRYEWKEFQPIGRTIKKNENLILKFSAYKKAETGDFSIKTTQKFRGHEEDKLTWWNGSWKYSTNTRIPDGPRPYQIPLILSNSEGQNDATHVFLNGQAKEDFSDVRFTLNNETILPYWIESRETGKVWVNVTGNGVVSLYYGNPSAISQSDGKSTFPFFEDFSADIGSNPVLSPTQEWEPPNLRWGTIAYLGGTYYIYYANSSGSTGAIGRATSTDLISWDKYAGNPIIFNSIGPSLLKKADGKTPVYYGGKYWMLTMKSDGSSIELRSAPSLDSNNWALENGNLINPAPSTWFSNTVFTTSFIAENGIYYIFLEGMDSSQNWNIGYFTATSPGGPYTNQGLLLAPTFPWEFLPVTQTHGGVLDPEARKLGNNYYLFYTGGLDKPFYNNSYARSSTIGGPFTKTQIQITPLGQTYPAILEKDSYYYILTDDHMTNSTLGTGKNLYRRKDLNGMFGSPFEWNKGGNPTVSGSELLINKDGEYLRTSSSFLYKALKVRAQYGSPASSYQYFGFGANAYAGDLNAEMFFSYSTPDLKASSGDTISNEFTSIYNSNYFGSYHDYEILWRNGEAKFLIDDVLRATHTSYVADTPQPVGIYDYKTNADLYIDWLFVRDYAVPEPAWEQWTGSQTSEAPETPEIPETPGTPETPEAVIKYNTSSKDLDVYDDETGTEAGYSVLEGEEKDWELREYTLNNNEGHSLKLILNHKKQDKEAKIRLVSTQYDNENSIPAVENEIGIKYSLEKDNSVKEIEQTIEADKLFEGQAKFKAGKNETEIDVQMEGQKKKKEKAAGMKLMNLMTDKGSLKLEITE